jgi:hypothetical protein
MRRALCAVLPFLLVAALVAAVTHDHCPLEEVGPSQPCARCVVSGGGIDHTAPVVLVRLAPPVRFDLPPMTPSAIPAPLPPLTYSPKTSPPAAARA